MIENLIDSGKLVEPPIRATPASTGRSPIDEFSLDARLQAKRMGSVYELLYCLENSMRELIESTLRDRMGPEEWWTDGIPERIRKSADKRREDDKRSRWHGPRGASLLAYTDFPWRTSSWTGGRTSRICSATKAGSRATSLR